MWQPIETAPRNQTFLAVLNCAGEQTICTMRWPVAEAKNSRPDNKTFHVERVTHWMPLPELPGAQPAPSINEGVRKVTLDFRWESEAQHHIPTIEIEFEPVSPESPNDAKSWQDRDRLAAMLTPEAKP